MNNYYFKREVLKFKRFTRKKYALFACLGKIVIVGVLSVATANNAKASGISIEIFRADNDTIPTDKEFDLIEVEVSGTRAPLSAGQAARMVTVLQAKDLECAAVQSVNGLLKLCAGVDVRQRAPMGAQTDISIRGGTSEHIAILLNGICISDPQTAHNALDLPVQLSEIERVEILEGPAARAYGAQSLLGEINIVTKKLNIIDKGDIHLEGGSFGYLSAGAAIPIPTLFSSIYNNISGSYSRSDGFNRSKKGNLNNDYESGKLFYQGNWKFLDWAFGFAKKRWGSSTSYGLGSDEQYERTDKMYANIQADIPIKSFHIRPAMFWQQNNDCYSWQRGISNPNYNRTDILGANINVWFDWILGRTTAGFELKNEDLLSGNLGEPISGTHKIPDTDRYYKYGINRTNISWTIEHNVNYKWLNISAGFMALRNTWNKMPYHIYPGIDAAFQIARHWKIYASWNTSMRLPSYTELYYKVDGHAADKNLLPEEMSAFEIGAKYASQLGTASISLYSNRGKNMIDWILDTRLGDSAVWQSVNHTKINSIGVELNSRLNLQKIIPNQKVLKQISVGYNYIHQDKREDESTLSLYSLEYIRHKVVASLNLQPIPNLNMSIFYRFQDRVGSYVDADGRKDNYSPYSIFDMRIDYSFSRYNIFLEANNLFCKQYIDYGNVRQPGVWLIAGIKATFDKYQHKHIKK